MSKKIVNLLLSLLLTSGVALNAQNRNIVYKGDTITVFPNPEWDWPYQTMSKCCDTPEDIARGIILPPHDLLEVEDLRSWRTSENTVSVFKDDVKIQQWTKDIPQSRLVEIILINRDSGEKFVLKVKGDGKGNRLWLPDPNETKTLIISG